MICIVPSLSLASLLPPFSCFLELVTMATSWNIQGFFTQQVSALRPNVSPVFLLHEPRDYKLKAFGDITPLPSFPPLFSLSVSFSSIPPFFHVSLGWMFCELWGVEGRSTHWEAIPDAATPQTHTSTQMFLRPAQTDEGRACGRRRVGVGGGGVVIERESNLLQCSNDPCPNSPLPLQLVPLTFPFFSSL